MQPPTSNIAESMSIERRIAKERYERNNRKVVATLKEAFEGKEQHEREIEWYKKRIEEEERIEKQKQLKLNI